MNICEISIAYSPAVRKINSTNRARVWIKILPVAAGTHNPLSGGIILYEIQTYPKSVIGNDEGGFARTWRTKTYSGREKGGEQNLL